MNHHEFPLDKWNEAFPKDVINPIKVDPKVTVAAAWAIFLGQPFPEQSEELRLEAITMGGCKQRIWI